MSIASSPTASKAPSVNPHYNWSLSQVDTLTKQLESLVRKATSTYDTVKVEDRTIDYEILYHATSKTWANQFVKLEFGTPPITEADLSLGTGLYAADDARNTDRYLAKQKDGGAVVKLKPSRVARICYVNEDSLDKLDRQINTIIKQPLEYYVKTLSNLESNQIQHVKKLATTHIKNLLRREFFANKGYDICISDFFTGGHRPNTYVIYNTSIIEEASLKDASQDA